MSTPKREMWLDWAFIALGLVILLLLFMPEQYIEYRYAGYAGVAVFLVFLIWREYRRKKAKKAGNENVESKNDEP